MSTVESDLNMTTTAQSQEKQSAEVQASPPTSEKSVQVVETPSLFPTKTNKEGANPWETCLEYANRYTEGEINVWKDEVDKLLIFAGLFSGVVASFAVEAYHNVKEDPADTTALLLRELLTLQLNATNPLPGFAGVELDPRTPVSASARRVIIYHFLSLFLSLSTAMAGIVCLQWIREHKRSSSGVPGSRSEHLGIHFIRHRSLESWKVFNILASLPLLLLLSLLLFFIGIIDLLLDVDGTAAAVSCAMAGITFLFMVTTTVLPGLVTRTRWSQCPYKSPQALVFYHLDEFVSQIVSSLMSYCGQEHSKPRFRVWTWSEFDSRVYADLKQRSAASVAHGLHRLGKIYLHSETFADAFYQCIRDDELHNSLHDILSRENKTRTDFFDNLELDNTTLRYSASDGQTADPEIMESQRKAYKHEILVYQILEHLVESFEQDRPSTLLLNQRLDVFLRLNRELDLKRAIGCPRVNEGHLRDQDPCETRKQLLDCILEMVERDKDYNDTHLLAVKSIVRLESQEREPDMEAFSRTIKTLNNWLGRREQDRNGARESAFEDRVKRLRNHIDVLRRLRRMR